MDPTPDDLLTALLGAAPAGALAYKTLGGPAAQLKVLGPDDPGGAVNGLLAGYSAVFGNWDRSGEKILPGAFAPFLDAYLKDGFTSWDHLWRFGGRPIATPVKAYEDDHGLFTLSEFHSTPDAQEARTLIAERMARGKSVTQSIGYLVADSEPVIREDTGARGLLLKALPLLEHSIALVPANPQARTTGVKSGLPAGLPYAVETDAVLAAVSAWAERTADLLALRTKAGRTLSAASRGQLQTMRDRLTPHAGAVGDVCAMLDAMLAPYADDADAPPDGGKSAAPLIDPQLIRNELAAILLRDLRGLGVLING